MHEAWPKAHHLAPPDLAIRRHHLCSGARPSAQPYVACATRSESLPITSRAGNDRNASPGELDFMHGGMTRRHEGCVSTMLTESDLSIPLALRHFKCLVRRKVGCKPTSTAFRVLFVLTMWDLLDPSQGRLLEVRSLARRMHRQDYPSSISKPLRTRPAMPRSMSFSKGGNTSTRNGLASHWRTAITTRGSVSSSVKSACGLRRLAP